MVTEILSTLQPVHCLPVCCVQTNYIGDRVLTALYLLCLLA